MSFLAKVELKKQLQKMGIKVEGNFVRKKDVVKVLAEKTEYDVSFRLTTEKEKDIKQDITKEFCKAIKQALDAQSDIELTNAIIESGINFCYTEMYGEMDIAHVYQYLKKNLNLSKIVEDVYLLIKETELTGDSSHDINLVGQNTIFHDKLN